jgi:hypothetical protein
MFYPRGSNYPLAKFLSHSEMLFEGALNKRMSLRPDSYRDQLKSIRLKAVAIFRCVFTLSHLQERHNGRLLRRMSLPFLRFVPIAIGIPRNDTLFYI